MKTINSFEEYQSEYKKSIDNPKKFWGEKAESFLWRKKWNCVLNWDMEEKKSEWYAGGKLNITENCLDRHLNSIADKTAILW